MHGGKTAMHAGLLLYGALSVTHFGVCVCGGRGGETLHLENKLRVVASRVHKSYRIRGGVKRLIFLSSMRRTKDSRHVPAFSSGTAISYWSYARRSRASCAHGIDSKLCTSCASLFVSRGVRAQRPSIGIGDRAYDKRKCVMMRRDESVLTRWQHKIKSQIFTVV